MRKSVKFMLACLLACVFSMPSEAKKNPEKGMGAYLFTFFNDPNIVFILLSVTMDILLQP